MSSTSSSPSRMRGRARARPARAAGAPAHAASEAECRRDGALVAGTVRAIPELDSGTDGAGSACASAARSGAVTNARGSACVARPRALRRLPLGARRARRPRPVRAFQRADERAEGSSCQRRRPWRRRWGTHGGCCATPRPSEGSPATRDCATVAGVEAVAAEEVAQRVDAVRRVVDEEDPRRAAPQQARQAAAAVSASSQPSPNAAAARRRPTAGTSGRRTHHRVGEQVLGVAPPPPTWMWRTASRRARARARTARRASHCRGRRADCAGRRHDRRTVVLAMVATQ